MTAPKAAEPEETVVEETGLDAALAALRERFDPGAMKLWACKGPRNTPIETIAGVLCTINTDRRIVTVFAYKDGRFALNLDAF